MAIKHVWPTVLATIASLKDNATGMPAKVTAFNGEAGHGVVLTAPPDAAYYPGGSDLLAVNGFPAVEVHIARGEVGSGENGFAVNRVEANVDDTVVVVIWAEGEKGEIPELYEIIVGLGRCALEVLVPTGRMGAGVEVMGVEYDYTIAPDDPTKGRDFEKWRTAVVLTFHVEDVTPIP